MLNARKHNAWIGLVVDDGVIQWDDQEPVTLTRFSPNVRMISLTPDIHRFQIGGVFGFARDVIFYFNFLG